MGKHPIKVRQGKDKEKEIKYLKLGIFIASSLSKRDLLVMIIVYA